MKNTELLNTQSSVEENNNLQSGNESTELIKMYRVKDTPFRVIHEADRGWYVVMLKYRLTEVFNTMEEVEEYTGLNFNYGEGDEEDYFTAGVTPLAFLTTIISAIVDETINLSNNKK